MKKPFIKLGLIFFILGTITLLYTAIDNYLALQKCNCTPTINQTMEPYENIGGAAFCGFLAYKLWLALQKINKGDAGKLMK